MNQIDVNSGVHQLPADCYPPTDSDDESFVVLERSTGPDSIYDGNRERPELLSSDAIETAIEYASEALTNMAKSALPTAPSMPSVGNAFTTSGYAISIANISNISTELSHEEIQEKVDLLIDDNVKLKETLHQNNLAMKNQFEKLVQWQADVEKVHESHKIKFAETKAYIKELQAEKAALKNTLDEYKTDNDAMKKSLLQRRQNSLELAKLTYENISTFETENQVQNLEKQIEELKLENSKEIARSTKNDQDQTTEISKLKKEIFEMDRIINLENDRQVDHLTQINNNQTDEITKLQEEIVKMKLLNEELQVKFDGFGETKIKYMEEIGNLKLANDKLRNHIENNEEIDLLRRQLMAAQVCITDLKQSKKAVEMEATANREKIDEMEKLVNELRSDKDRAVALDDQLTVYKLDFEAERESKDRILAEKNKLAEDMHHMQLRTEKHLQEIENLREKCEFIEVNDSRAGGSSTTAQPTAPPSPPPTTYHCPLCNWKCRSLHLLEEHVEQCLSGQFF